MVPFILNMHEHEHEHEHEHAVATLQLGRLPLSSRLL